MTTPNATRQPFLDGRDTIREEYAQIAAGTHFWCETHLSAVHVDFRSPDPRYCQDCYDFLTEEANMLIERGTTKRPAWIPNPRLKGLRGPVTPTTLSFDVPQGVTAQDTPRKALDGAISVLSRHGLGCRQIAEQLFTQGYGDISYRTVARHMRRLKDED